jgi:hypothetical protein
VLQLDYLVSIAIGVYNRKIQSTNLSQQNVGQSSTPSNCNLFEPLLKRRKMNTTSELEKAIAQFVDEKWELQRNIEIISPCNLSLLKRGDLPQDKPEAILFKFIPSSVWKIFVDVINRNLSSGSTISSQLKSRNRMATLNDVIHFYTITMMIENTWGNDKRNLKKHFRDISEKYGSSKECVWIDISVYVLLSILRFKKFWISLIFFDKLSLASYLESNWM